MAKRTRAEWEARIAELEGTGDYDTANKIRAALGMPAAQKPPEPPSQAESARRGLGQGLTFGFGDELSGLIGAGLDHMFGPDYTGFDDSDASFGENYAGLRDQERVDNRAAQAANPWTYGLSEFAGGMAVPGVGTLKGAQYARRANRSLQPLGAMALSGAGSGAVAGLGYSDADTFGGTAADTAFGSALGGVGAPLIGWGANMVGRGLSNVAGGLKRRLAQSPDEQARLRLGQALNAEDLGSVEAVRARLNDLGPEATLADVGPVLQQEAVAAAKVPGAGRRVAYDLVEGRQAGQEGRLAQITRETIDPKWTDYQGYLKTVREELKSQSSEAYKRAYERGIEPDMEMAQWSRHNDYFKSALSKAMDNVRNDVDAYPGTAGLQDSGMVSTKLMDYTMRELRDMADKAFRKGANNQGRMIKALERHLREKVFAQNPDLKAAMSVYRGGKELEGAAQRGRELLFKKVRPDELKLEMADWSASEKESFRIGLMQGIFDKIEDAATGQNSATRVVNSSRAEKILKEAFGDGEAFAKFMKAVDAESAMQGTRNKVTGGSPTMELLTAEGRRPDLAPSTGGGALGWLQRVWLQLGQEHPDVKKLTPDDYEAMSKYLFGELDDDTIASLINPTLRSRAKETGVLGPVSGLLGASTSQSLIGDYGRLARGQ